MKKFQTLAKLAALSTVMTGCVAIPQQGQTYYTSPAPAIAQAPAQKAIVIKENADGTATTNFVEVAAQPAQQQAPAQQTQTVFAPLQFLGNALETVNGAAAHYQPTISTALGVADTVNGFRSVNAQKKNAKATSRVAHQLGNINSTLQGIKSNQNCK